MNAYEQIITTMREQGAKYNNTPLQIGEMISDTICLVGDIELENDDYLIADHLTDRELVIDLREPGKITATISTTDHTHKLTDLETEKSHIKIYSKLKKGDIVLAQRMSDELYVIIERLVKV